MVLQEWSTVTFSALQNLWQGFLIFIPKLVGALIIFLLGWFISVWIGKLVAEVLKRLKLDKIFEKGKWEEAMNKADFKMKMSEFIGGIVKWILVIVFLLATVQILGLSAFAGFLGNIVAWMPNLVIATAIFVVAAVVGDFSEKMVKVVTGKMSVHYTNFIGSVIKWAIWVFAIFAMLSQLGVAPEIVQILVSGIVALVVVSCALAFGLGGKDVARDILENMRTKLRK